MSGEFGFLAPERLVFIVLPALLALGYLLQQARRRRFAIRFTTIEMLDQVAPDKPGWRRHITALGLLVAVVIGILAFARPVIAGETEEENKLVVLAIDTSISMEAEDVLPTRVDAARESAKVFLDSVPEGVAVGVVGFDGTARQLIAPTTRLEAVRRVIDGSINRSGLGEGTAIGEAVFAGIEAIETAAEDSGADSSSPDEAVGTIVLLSDGDTTVGRGNAEAASAALAAGIPVHTIAFGTDAGTVRDPLGVAVAVPVNEQALEELAAKTGGSSVTAATLGELSDVYEELGKAVTVEKEPVEVGDLFTGAAMVILALAGIGSLAWFGRLP